MSKSAKEHRIPTVAEVAEVIARSFVELAEQGCSRNACIASAAAAARPFEDLLRAKPPSEAIH